MTLTSIDSAELARLQQIESVVGTYIAFIAATFDYFGVTEMKVHRENLARLAGSAISVEADEDTITFGLHKEGTSK